MSNFNYDPGNFFHSTPMVFGEGLSVLGGIALIVLGIVTVEIKPIMAGTTMVTGGGAGLAYASKGRNKDRPPSGPQSPYLGIDWSRYLTPPDHKE